MSQPLHVLHLNLDLDRLFHFRPLPQHRPEFSPGLHEPHWHSAVYFGSEYEHLAAVERVGGQAVQTNETPNALHRLNYYRWFLRGRPHSWEH